MAGSFYWIDVAVRARGAQRTIGEVNRSLHQLDTTANKVARTLDRMFKLGTTALLVSGLVSIVDTYTTLSNKVATTTKSVEEQNAVMDELFNVANRARIPIEAAGAAYQRLRNATLEMGLSQKQVLQLTETLNKGLLAYGATQQEATSSMTQFTQALQKGKLDGDEFRSQMENNPALVKLLTKELNISKGELFAWSKAGKLGARDLVSALTNGAGEIEERFGKMTPTIGQSLTVLRNNFIRFVGELATSSGLAKALSEGILFVADNFDVFAKVVLAASQALGVVFASKAIKAAVAGLRALSAAALANPFTAILAGLALVISLLYQFDVNIKSVGTGTIRFQRVVEAAWKRISSAIESAASKIGSALVEMFDFFYEGFKDLEIGFGDILVFIGIFVDKAVAVFSFFAKTSIATLAGIPVAIGLAWLNAFATLLQLLEAFINKVLGAYNKIASKVSSRLTIGTVDISGGVDSLRDRVNDMAKDFVTGIADDFKAITSTDLGPVASAIRDILDEATGGRVKKGLADLTEAGDDVFKGIPEKGKKTRDEFDKLIESLYPTIKAMNDLRDAKITVDKELAKGGGDQVAISITDVAREVELLNEKYTAGTVTAQEYAAALQEIADVTKRRATSRLIDQEDANQVLDRQRYILLESADALGHYNYMAEQAQLHALALAEVQDQLPTKFAAEIKAREKLNELIEKGIVLSDFELAAREQRGVDTTADRQFREQQLERIRLSAELEAHSEAQAEAAIERNRRLSERLANAVPDNQRYSESLQEIADQYAALGPAVFNFDEALADLDKTFGLVQEKLADDANAEAARRLREELEELNSVTTLLGIGFQALGDQIVSAVTKGEASFQQLVDTALESLTRIILKAIETRIYLALLGQTGPSIDMTNYGALLKPAGFAEGGHFMVGGQPGRDKNLFAMRLSRGEDVRIRTPAQRRADENSEGDAPPAIVNLYNVNQTDPGQMVPVMSSGAGRRVTYNNLRYAPRAVARLR